jgi:hypothetical protein
VHDPAPLQEDIFDLGGDNKVPRAHGTTKPPCVGATHQSAAKMGRAVGKTDGRLAACAHRVNTARAKEAPQSPAILCLRKI